jgi:uncharacterized protein
MKLQIGATFTLPLDAITQTFGILAVRGAGKSNLAAVMAEEMFVARLPFVVIDPVGAWHGLRGRGDGKGEGLAVPIFGGRQGDVPLERASGQLIADLVVDQRLTCVLDVSEFSEGDKVRFLIDFAERLYRRNTQPLHLFLEEADDYCPQRFTGDRARLVGAWQNIVRRGRARGLGITMITQRSAVLNKDILTQIETLFVLRTTSPQDRNAIEAWVKYQGGAPEMLKTLQQLESGEAWVWSPSWLQTFERIRVRRRWTFDSGATPKGGKATKPATLADVDLGAIRTAMADTIERAKADDPKALRVELAEAKKRIAQLERAPAKAETKTTVTVKEVPALSAKDRAALERSADKLHTLADRLEAVAVSARDEMAGARKLAEQLRTALAPPVPMPSSVSMRQVTKPGYLPSAQTTTTVERRPARTSNGHGTITEKLAGGERKILTALAQYPAGRTKVQVALLTGYAHNGGGFNNYISALRGRGLLEGSGDALRATDAGLDALGDYTPLPTGPALLEHWLRQLGKAERSALNALAAAYPDALTKDALADRAGYEANGGGFNNALSRLRTLELISGRGELRASEELFD